MKNFLFVLSGFAVFIRPESAWAFGSLREAMLSGAYPGAVPFVLVMAVMLLMFCSSDGVDTTEEEIESYRRIKDNSIEEYKGEQHFELDIYNKQLFRLLYALALMTASFVVLALLYPLESFNLWGPGVLLLVFAAALGWWLSIILRTAFLIKAAPETIVVKHWWPYSPLAIHNGDVRHIELEWAFSVNRNPLWFSFRKLMPEISALVIIADVATAPKVVKGIRFVMKNGEKHSVRLSSFRAGSVEKLIQFLKQAGIGIVQ